MRKVNWLRQVVLNKGGKLADFHGMATEEIIDKATSVLSNIIGVRVQFLEPIYYPLKRFELSFYRNQVIHLFIAESILSTALYGTIKAGGSRKAQRIKLMPDLMDDVSFLSTLFKLEFIYSTGGFQINFNNTLRELKDANVLDIEIENDDQFVMLSSEERRIGRENFGVFIYLSMIF